MLRPIDPALDRDIPPLDCIVLRLVVRVVPAERAALSRSSWLVVGRVVEVPVVGRVVAVPDPAPVVGRVVPVPEPAVPVPAPVVGRVVPVPVPPRSPVGVGRSTESHPPDPLLDSQPLPVLR